MKTNNLKVARQLEELAMFCRNNQASEIMVLTINKLLKYESETERRQLDDLKSDMSDFEKRYDMESQEFFELFQNGKLDDRMDFIEWASIVQMAERLEKKIQEIS